MYNKESDGFHRSLGWPQTGLLGEEVGDYPSGMINKYEKAELAEGLTTEESAGYYRNGHSRACGPVNLRRLASSRYEEAGDDVPPRHVSRMLAAIAEYEIYKMPESMRFKMRELIDIDLSRYYPEDRRWVLRNLTTRDDWSATQSCSHLLS